MRTGLLAHVNNINNPLQESSVLIPMSSCFHAGWKGKSGKESRLHSRAKVPSNGNPHQFSFKPSPILLSLSPLQPLFLTLSISPPHCFCNQCSLLCAHRGVWLLVGDKTSLYQPHIRSSPLILIWVSVWVN